tara:strand:+ start:954 stop:1235 length:282 start_codon:yes stop_codon:yes gene_type:complete
MSDSDSDIDEITAQADGDASAEAGAEEASQDPIDAMFGDGAADEDWLSIDEILGESGGEVAEASAEGAVNPILQMYQDRAVQDIDVELSVVLG